MYHKYRKRGKTKPFVYIDVTPNERGMLDCYVFNAPLLKMISVTAVFKDPRQLCDMGFCKELSDNNMSWIYSEIEKRLTEFYVRYYR
jgi:hypothetical protein